MIPENNPLDEDKKKSIDQQKPTTKFLDYFSAGTRDMIAYILLVLGVILLFFQPLYGEFLIGVVAGAYFSKEINDLFKNYQNFIEQQGLVRSLILGGIFIAFLVSAPGIFIGAAFVMVLKLFIFFDDRPTS